MTDSTTKGILGGRLTPKAFLALAVAWLLPAGASADTPVSPRPTKAVFAVTTASPYVALTFDDGPSPTFTPKILRTLSRHHAHGTFFLLGSLAKSYPGTVRQIVSQGSEAEAHGYTHTDFSKLSRAAALRQIRLADAAIQEASGIRPHFFRPPYGSVGSALRGALEDEKQVLVLWSIDTRDWSGLTASSITRAALSGIRPGDIILFHDGGGNRTATLRALRRILPLLEARRLEAVTLATLWRSGQPIHHDVVHSG